MSTYDADTGQMYVESSVRFRSRHHSDWIGELKTPSLVRRSLPYEGPGPRSLSITAVNQVAQQFRNLTADHFAGVPWSLAERLWQVILETHRESFHAWRVMASAYPDQMADRSHRYHLHFRQPSLAALDYFSGLTSQPARWLTCLRVSPKELRGADLVAVAQITNLAVLDLSDGQVSIDNLSSPFDERLIRTWAELAVKKQAFRRLEALFLGWQNIDSWLFQYLPCFPALTKVIVTDSSRVHQKNRKEWEPTANEFGWDARHAKRSAKSLRPVFDDPGFHRCAISGVMSQFEESDGQAHGHMAHPRLPVVEFWLGTPRKWSHILEDFPGTRTVYLDRISVVNRIPRFIASQLGSDVQQEPTKRGRHVDQQFSNRLPPSKRVTKVNLKPRRRGPTLTELLR